MATVSPITDGNLYAVKTTDTPPIEPGEEPLKWGMLDANNIRAFLVAIVTALNRNAGVDVQPPHTAEELVIADDMSGQHIPLDASANAIEVEIQASVLAPGVGITLAVIDITNPITIVTTGPSGFETSFTGKAQPDAVGDSITIIMESTTRARVTIVGRTSTTVIP